MSDRAIIPKNKCFIERHIYHFRHFLGLGGNMQDFSNMHDELKDEAKKKKVNVFTERGIQSEKPLEGQTKFRDIREKKGEGFALTVFPSGKKSFIYIYHFGGRKRRMTLGKHPQCSLADARILHREALTILKSGKDPADEKQKAKIAVRDSSTVEGLIEEYLEKWARPNKRSAKADERCLYKDVKPYSTLAIFPEPFALRSVRSTRLEGLSRQLK